MTYFAFLFRFLLIPILLLAGLAWFGRRRRGPRQLSGWTASVAAAVHAAIALLYTTPWDNYLVATGVWWYDPALVTGITLGWVPIEEYTFFLLQPLLAGLWLHLLAHYLPPGPDEPLSRRLRLPAVLALMPFWPAAAAALAAAYAPATYLALEVVWALPPLMLQLAFGADILWRYRRVVVAGIIPLTLYLSAVDSLAIGAGTWTISPAHSLNIFLGGVLPLEEFLFFLLTNTLLICGMVLLLAPESRLRFGAVWARLRQPGPAQAGLQKQKELRHDRSSL